MNKTLASKYGIRLLTDDTVVTENVEVIPDHPENITPSNIRKGIVILGETGSYEATDTSSDTVTADVLLSPYTAHDANGVQITGNIETMPGQTVTANGTVETAGKYLDGDIEVAIPEYDGASEDITSTFTFSFKKGSASATTVTCRQYMSWEEWFASSYNTTGTMFITPLSPDLVLTFTGNQKLYNATDVAQHSYDLPATGVTYTLR